MGRKIIKCKECGEEKPHEALGLCVNCYRKNTNKKICKECGKLKFHYAKGLCTNCYSKKFQKQNLIICKKCGKLKPHRARGLCHACINHKMGKNKSMSENKECASYLGIVVAEKLLSKVFKNVKQMPNNNIGFDFICSKDMKIDVKSSVLRFDKRFKKHKGNWSFRINKNTIADYFLCIAFDNRTDKNPQHLWLIPTEKINHLVGLNISKLQTHKWTQYEQSLNKTLECCNELKQM